MCLIVITPKSINEYEFYKAKYANPDGIGIYVFDNRKVYKFYELSYDKYKALTKNKQHVIHFRYATHGKINKDNIHPITINKRYILFHNGIIDIPTINDYSDTKTLSIFLSRLKINEIFQILNYYAYQNNRFVLVDKVNNTYYTFGNFIKHNNQLHSNGLLLRNYLDNGKSNSIFDKSGNIEYNKIED